MGYTADGKFHILSVDGNELLVADIMVDDKLAHPQPLKIVMDGATAKLYLGKKYVTLYRAVDSFDSEFASWRPRACGVVAELDAVGPLRIR